MDTLACGFQALEYPACTKLLGPVVPGAAMPGGARVPGTSYELDPVQAAFNIGAMVRWLDFNDTWLAAEWGHRRTTSARILAVADYLARKRVMEGKQPLTMRDVLTAMIKAHEIQGVLALENSFNRVGLDHVLLVRIASTAVVTAHARRHARADHQRRLERLDRRRRAAHLSPRAEHRLAQELGRRRCDERAPCGTRCIALTGEMGYPSALTAKTWGFYDVLFKGKPFTLPQPFGSYVMENVLFKISFPAEFHAQTAVEARDAAASAGAATASTRSSASSSRRRSRRAHHRQDRAAREPRRPRPLHPVHGGRAADLRPPHRRRLRGRGRRRSAHRRAAREDAGAREPDVHAGLLRLRTSAPSATPSRCSSATARARRASQVDFPIGHRRRRAEGMPVLVKKFEASVAAHFSAEADRADPRDVRRRGEARCHAGERADGDDGDERHVDRCRSQAADRGCTDASGVALVAAGRRKSSLRLLDELAQWNRTHNLTAITKRERDDHASPARQPVGSVRAVRGRRWRTWAPVPAFPGCRWPWSNPQRRFTLIDSNNKKMRFVAHAARELGLTNVTPLHARAEAFKPDAPFDTVIARAFAPLPEMLEKIAPLCGPRHAGAGDEGRDRRWTRSRTCRRAGGSRARPRSKCPAWPRRAVCSYWSGQAPRACIEDSVLHVAVNDARRVVTVGLVPM